MEGIACILNRGEEGCAALGVQQCSCCWRGACDLLLGRSDSSSLPGLGAEGKEHLPRLCRCEREAPEVFSLGAKPVSMLLAAVSGHLVKVIAMAIEMRLSFLENKHFVRVWTRTGSIYSHWQLSLLPQALNFLWLKWSQAHR